MWGATTPRTTGATAGLASIGPGPSGVGRARRRRGPCRRREKPFVDDGSPIGEGGAVEETLLVEGLGDVLDLPALQQLAVAAHDGRLDVRDRVLAVEQGDDLEQGAVQQDDRVGVAAGITERDAGSSLVLDGEGFHGPQPGDRLAHCRKFSAEAT